MKKEDVDGALEFASWVGDAEECTCFVSRVKYHEKSICNKQYAKCNM